MSTKPRSDTDSYSASSTAGYDKLNHCCQNKSAACAPLPPVDALAPPSDTPAQSARITPPTAPPAPSLPETQPAVSSSCTVQTRSALPVSAVSFASPPMLSSIYPQHRWKMESLIRVSLGVSTQSAVRRVKTG